MTTIHHWNVEERRREYLLSLGEGGGGCAVVKWGWEYVELDVANVRSFVVLVAWALGKASWDWFLEVVVNTFDFSE